jgi:hypothetical protein
MKQSIVQILFYVLQSGIKALSAPFTLPQSLLLDRFISLGSAFSSEAHVQNAQKWSSRDEAASPTWHFPEHLRASALIREIES